MKYEDQEWLEALAREDQINNKSLNQLEASAVRRALLARRNAIEIESKKFDLNQYQKLKKKLTQNGHLTKSIENESKIIRVTKLISSFIAGSITTALLMIGISSQVMITRGGGESVNKDEIGVANIELQESIVEIKTHDPIALVQALESKAWESGLRTIVLNSSGEFNLVIEKLPKSSNEAAELKLLLGVNPQTFGDIVVKISVK